MELEKYIISKKYGRIYFKIDEDDYNKIINEGFKISISNYTKKHPYLKLYKKINNKSYHIGYYNTIQEAVNARKLYKEKVLEVY